MSKNILIPVILCGGTGSRLWPLSRRSFPKQFISILDSKDSLLQSTEKRILGIKNIKNPILICNEEHRFIVADQMKEININPKAIILEPFGKNTAPAITIAALKALEEDEEAILIILSSDHSIKDNDKFLEVVNLGQEFASKGNLVTFGIVPSFPSTGYGYIKSEREFNIKKIEGLQISEFIEKPDIKLAEEFVKDKKYTWNSGIFMFKAKKILEEIKSTNQRYSSCKKALGKSIKDLDFERLDLNEFKNAQIFLLISPLWKRLQ